MNENIITSTISKADKVKKERYIYGIYTKEENNNMNY